MVISRKTTRKRLDFHGAPKKGVAMGTQTLPSHVIDLFSHRKASNANYRNFCGIETIYDGAVIRGSRLYFTVRLANAPLPEQWLKTLGVTIAIEGTSHSHTVDVAGLVSTHGETHQNLCTEQIPAQLRIHIRPNTPLIITLTSACGNHHLGLLHTATKVAK